jgi:hypothetical protein
MSSYRRVFRGLHWLHDLFSYSFRLERCRQTVRQMGYQLPYKVKHKITQITYEYMLLYPNHFLRLICKCGYDFLPIHSVSYTFWLHK